MNDYLNPNTYLLANGYSLNPLINDNNDEVDQSINEEGY